jgi:hypothetical protein
VITTVKSDPQKSVSLWFGFNLRRSTEDKRRLEITRRQSVETEIIAGSIVGQRLVDLVDSKDLVDCTDCLS